MVLYQIIFLHALPLDGRMWASELERYGGRSVAPTLYSFGESLQDWSAGVLEAASDGPLIIVGCSVGGACALEVAQAAPDRVLGAVLVGAKAGVRPDPLVRDEAIDTVRALGPQTAWEKYWLPIFGRNTSKETVDTARSIALAQDPEQLVNGLRAFHDRRDLTGFAHTWHGTIVSISGDQDRTPRASANAEWTSLPNRSAHVVEDCGHYVSLEQPERFESLLDAAISLISMRALPSA